MVSICGGEFGARRAGNVLEPPGPMAALTTDGRFENRRLLKMIDPAGIRRDAPRMARNALFDHAAFEALMPVVRKSGSQVPTLLFGIPRNRRLEQQASTLNDVGPSPFARPDRVLHLDGLIVNRFTRFVCLALVVQHDSALAFDVVFAAAAMKGRRL